jgi:hypothetical protein
MNKRIAEDFQEVIQPIASLISKSEKTQQKLTPGTWQHRMVQENLRALHIAFELMNGRTSSVDVLTTADLQAALVAFADMTKRGKKAQAKFTPGTSQHTLQRNRLRALRAAVALISASLK